MSLVAVCSPWGRKIISLNNTRVLEIGHLGTNYIGKCIKLHYHLGIPSLPYAKSQHFCNVGGVDGEVRWWGLANWEQQKADNIHSGMLACSTGVVEVFWVLSELYVWYATSFAETCSILPYNTSLTSQQICILCTPYNWLRWVTV